MLLLALGGGGCGARQSDKAKIKNIRFNLYSRQINRKQKPFVSRWKSEELDKKVTLPLVKHGNYSFMVNWGDYSESWISRWDDPNKTHHYAIKGIYTITITGYQILPL